MKRNKTKLAALIIVVLLVFFMVYLQLRDYNSYKNRIHKQANTIIKINVDGIYKTLAIDFITNPSYYLKKEKGGKGSEVKKGNGIKMPANIFLFNVNTKSASTFFCSLPLTDTAAFKQFISQKLNISSFIKINNSAFLGTSKDGKLTIAYTSNNMSIAYSVNKEEVLDILTDLLNHKNILTKDDDKIKRLKQTTNHIDYLSSTNAGFINFKDGEITLNAEFACPDSLMITNKNTHRIFSKDATLKMWLNAGINKFVNHRTFNLNNYALQTDSLLKNYTGYVDAEWINTVTQTDSVITYNYTDDFEKVEKLNLKEVQVPELSISLKGNANGLFNYLKNENIIQDDHRINKEFFPLYSVYASKNGDHFWLSTKKYSIDHTSRENSNYFFFLEMNLDKIKSQNLFPLLNRYISNSSLLTAKAEKTGSTILVESSIIVKYKGVNALPQFLNQFL
ncbi:MAG: hypothetical protein WBP45_07425 [Daejeonella sp.]